MALPHSFNQLGSILALHIFVTTWVSTVMLFPLFQKTCMLLA